jgi:hypothetical protein
VSPPARQFEATGSPCKSEIEANTAPINSISFAGQIETIAVEISVEKEFLVIR